MPRPTARDKFADFDPNKSDSNDSDFEVDASSPRPRRPTSSKRKKQSSSQHRTPQKRRPRGGYGGRSDSDIVDDDDDISNDEFTESSEEEIVERNEKGRAVRSAVKKAVNYEESDVDEEEQFIEETGESDNERDELNISPKKTRTATATATATAGRGGLRDLLKPSKIVRLPFTQWEGLSSSSRPSPIPQIKAEKMANVRSTRSASRHHSRPPTATSTAVGTRKSSRLSKEPEAHVELSNSGRHAIPASSPDDDDDELPARRRTVGSKGPRQAAAKKMPSVVMEQSQEGTQAEGEDEEEDAGEPEEHHHDVVDSVEIQVEDADAADAAEEEPAPETILETDIVAAADEEAEAQADAAEEGGRQLQAEGSDDSDGPVSGRRVLRKRDPPAATRSPAKRKRADDESSEFAPEEVNAGDEDMSAEEDDGRRRSKRIRAESSSQSNNGRKSRRATRSRHQSSDEDESDEIDEDELLEEAQSLSKKPKDVRRKTRAMAYEAEGIAFDDTNGRSRRRTNNVDYTIKPVDFYVEADMQAMAQSEGEPSQGRRKGKKKRAALNRPLHQIKGIFGGWGMKPALLTSDLDTITMMGDKAEADLSDEEDDVPAQLKTPAAHDAAGGPAEFGKINKEKKLAGADTDPLGVDENVKFDAVGGLDDHINALKEMVLHPLMYPEVIGKFGVQPPRGVLFHGPPGTGKTLLARALSNSIESEGKKVTFFMRKGADALSKWVGEAERQLRLLFEEAQKCQPSIIFFDEIDGLAPTRSSKTEQIHASIVATLLALMDGMDNRGQVVVIGATNRPDNVDPALRRPGRFDREFYFPLPDKTARLSIIDINTKGWEPALTPQLKDNLAELTVGYGGADLRALCTEAALNAIQGTYPQIYKSNKKLLVDPSKIKVLAKDFMISVNKITPSSARSNTSKVEPLQKSVEPLLRKPLEEISKLIDSILPRRKKLTALEEAEFDDREDECGFERDMLQRDIDRAKIFRPRLLIRGLRGMGQQELSSALLHKLEGLFVQSFDMATLMEDSSRSPEAAVVQLFKEVRRQKPSIIFVPDVDIWYQTVGDNVLKIFMQQLRSIPPNDPVLLLGMVGTDTIEARPDPAMLRDLFGFSKRSDYLLDRPGRDARYEYWSSLVTLLKKRPTEFPDPLNRKRRHLEVLPEVKPTASELRTQDKAKKRQQKREERNALNLLKINIGLVFEQIKKKYGFLRNAQIPLQQYKYLFEDADDGIVTSDLTEEQRQEIENRPFVLDKDRHGRGVLREKATGKFYYNMDIEDIEERLANGYYRRWRDFLADIRTIMHDAMTVDPQACPDPEKQDERRRKTQELVNNVEVDLDSFRRKEVQLDQQLTMMWARRLEEFKELRSKGEKVPQVDEPELELEGDDVQHPIGTTTNHAPMLGRPPLPGETRGMGPPPITPLKHPHAHTNGESGSGSGLTNGSTVPSRGHADAEGDLTMEDVTPAHAATQPRILSQRSALEKMAPGSQVDDYRNSGSTTTSGQNHSNRTSGAGANPQAQAHQNASTWSAHTPSGFPAGYTPAPPGTVGVNPAAVAPGIPGAAAPSSVSNGGAGVVPAPGAGVGPAAGGHGSQGRGTGPAGSQEEGMDNSNGTESRYYPQWQSAGYLDNLSQSIPDTQPLTDHSNSLPATSTNKSSSTQPAPAKTAIANLLNNSQENGEVHPPFQLREQEIQNLHLLLAERTSGFSVEQLVQCMAELVGEVIRNSREWDKRVVVENVGRVFEEVRGDIEEMQVVMEGSYGG